MTSTESTPSLLDMIAADEQSLLRTGEMARQLIKRHGDLPLRAARLRDGDVHLNAPSAGDVRAWAGRLGAEVTETTDDPGYGVVFAHTTAETEVDGVTVHIWHCRILTDAEAAAWREATEAS